MRPILLIFKSLFNVNYAKQSWHITDERVASHFVATVYTVYLLLVDVETKRRWSSFSK